MRTNAQRKENYDFHGSETEFYQQLKTFYDSKNRIGWFLMNAKPRPCFTPTLLADISSYFTAVKQDSRTYDFLVLASDVKGIFNLGGDLNLFASLIQQQDRAALLDYAASCIRVLHDNMNHLNQDTTTISLVKGDALGGGFEAALSSNILIAERGVKMGLPEILFNLFPGMGAYSLLSRKVGSKLAEDMIFSGKLYLAEDLYKLGIVDILAEKGEAEIALSHYIKTVQRSPNSYQAMRKVKDICHTIDYQELFDITKIWVDTALKLTEKDLKMMHRLIKRQSDKTNT